jgi:putative FmdB family regulatory protein
MPTYDYECDACGHSFEKFQSITAPAVRKCPECGKRKVRRLIGTGAGVIFKGSGFYQTDYRSESYKKAAEKDSKTATGDSGGPSDSAAKSDGGKTSGSTTKDTTTKAAE